MRIFKPDHKQRSKETYDAKQKINPNKSMWNCYFNVIYKILFAFYFLYSYSNVTYTKYSLNILYIQYLKIS